MNLVGELVGTAAVTLLSNGELEKNVRVIQRHTVLGNITYLDTLALGEGNPRLLLSNDEDVGLTGSELVVKSIANVDDVETTVVTLTVSDDTNTTHVATTSGHDDNTGIELDEVKDLASGNVDLDGVVDLDGRVGVADAVESKRKLAKPCPDLMGSYCFHCPPPINQSLVQRLNDTELVECGTHVRASCVTKNGIPPLPS